MGSEDQNKKKKEKEDGESEAVNCDSHKAAYCKTIKYNDDSCKKFQSSCGAPNDNDEAYAGDKKEQDQTQTATPCDSTLDSVVSLFEKANTGTKEYTKSSRKGKPLQEALAQFAKESKEAKICVVSGLKWGKSKYYKHGEYSKAPKLVDELKKCCEKAKASQPKSPPLPPKKPSQPKSPPLPPKKPPASLAKKCPTEKFLANGCPGVREDCLLCSHCKWDVGKGRCVSEKSKQSAKPDKKEDEKTANGESADKSSEDQNK